MKRSWWPMTAWGIFALVLVFGFVLPALQVVLFPRLVEATRLGSKLNEELNDYLETDRRFGWAQSFGGASREAITFHVYGVTDEGNQEAVRAWLAAVKQECQLQYTFVLKFYEDYRKAGSVKRLLRTIEL